MWTLTMSKEICIYITCKHTIRNCSIVFQSTHSELVCCCFFILRSFGHRGSVPKGITIPSDSGIGSIFWAGHSVLWWHPQWTTDSIESDIIWTRHVSWLNYRVSKRNAIVIQICTNDPFRIIVTEIIHIPFLVFALIRQTVRKAIAMSSKIMIPIRIEIARTFMLFESVGNWEVSIA